MNIKTAVEWENESPYEPHEIGYDNNEDKHFGIYTFDCKVEDFDPEAGFGAYPILNTEWWETEKERDNNLK